MTNVQELKRLRLRCTNCRANLKRAMRENAPAKTIAYFQLALNVAENAHKSYREIYLADRRKKHERSAK